MSPDQPDQRCGQHHEPCVYRHQGGRDVHENDLDRSALHVIVRSERRAPDEARPEKQSSSPRAVGNCAGGYPLEQIRICETPNGHNGLSGELFRCVYR